MDGHAAVPVRLRLGYIAPYVEYAFYSRGPWEARIPRLRWASARVPWCTPVLTGSRHTVVRSFLLIYEPAMTIQYRFLRYFGAQAGWGYRLMLVRTGLDEALTAPIYILGLVFVGDLWRDLRR